ncbi:hypothetical protein OOK31_34950 [Streptomyces sp. NBC_00249]|uniref:hypothetical protein n=1 Tax=Streptomyces sp. NBC_00249 TaxID=2975690 RepID=UPI00225A08D0|nr:hypothetical protein [Streptomyces sp. NBC_00249]MCX5199027.1 hypothetical protein [Streptomyces sp. NBC_00249]
MHRTKPSRLRVLVPSALAVVIFSGAAAPAGAADGEGSASLVRKAEVVQQQIEGIESRVAAGPIDDLLSSLTKTLADLLKSVTGLLPPGVALPPITLPTLPKLPDIPGLPDLKLPSVTIPQLPAAPALSPTDGLVPAVPAVPGTPTVPDLLIPEIPEVPVP